MTAILFVLLVPALVFCRYFFMTRRSYFYCVRAALITFGIALICVFPIGKFETRTVPVDKDGIASSKYLYVVPCQHTMHGTVEEVHITPPYTSLGIASLCDDLCAVAYCDECHTRKEAINVYLSKR